MKNTNLPNGTVSSKRCLCPKQKQAQQILYSGRLLDLLTDSHKEANTDKMPKKGM